MNIAALKGDQNIKALATRLLAKPAKSAPEKATQLELETELLRLNPHLAQIGDLPEGTPVIVPDDFGLAADESSRPLRGMTEALVEEGEKALTNLQVQLEAHAAETAAQVGRVQAWLKSDEAKETARSTPAFKEVFASATEAAAAIPKEQTVLNKDDGKAIDEVRTVLSNFRARAMISPTR